MKKLTEILKDLKQGKISTDHAEQQVLDLFTVSESLLSDDEIKLTNNGFGALENAVRKSNSMEELNYVVFSKKQGSGYIQTDPKVINSRLLLQSVTLNDKVILPGQYVTLDGFFCRHVRYLGILNKEDKNEMIFYLGIDDGKIYYESIFWVSNTRIFQMYAKGSGRDYNFVKGKWK